jgi:hypothetical protein
VRVRGGNVQHTRVVKWQKCVGSFLKSASNYDLLLTLLLLRLLALALLPARCLLLQRHRGAAANL